MIAVLREAPRMKRPMPVSMPPEPTPTTIASTSPSIWRRISGPVVVACACGLAGLANWFTKKAPGARRAILERARGVRALELQKKPTGATVDARHLDERRVADEIKDRCHGGL